MAIVFRDLLILLFISVNVCFSTPTSYDYTTIPGLEGCELDVVSLWLEKYHPWILATADDLLVESRNISEEENLSKPIDAEQTEVLKEPATLKVEGLTKYGMLKPEVQVSLSVTSHELEQTDILVFIDSDPKISSCGLGEFSGDSLDYDATNLNATTDQSYLIPGDCFFWASGVLMPDDTLQMTYTAPDCGCVTIKVFMAFEDEHDSFIVGPGATKALEKYLCVNPFKNNKNKKLRKGRLAPTIDENEPKASALAANYESSGENISVEEEENKNAVEEENKNERKQMKQNRRKKWRKTARKGVHKINRSNSSDVSKERRKPWKTGGGKGRWKNRRNNDDKRRRHRRRRINRPKWKKGANVSSSVEPDIGDDNSKVESSTQMSLQNSVTDLDDTANGNFSDYNELPTEPPEDLAVNFFLGLNENGTEIEEGEGEIEERDGEEKNGIDEQLLPTSSLEDHVGDKEDLPRRTKKLLAKSEKKKKWNKRKNRKLKKKKVGKKVTYGDRMCCKHGIQMKKAFLFLAIDEDKKNNSVCNETSKEVLLWSSHNFQTDSKVCEQRFFQCCSKFTLEWLDDFKKKREIRKEKRRQRKSKKFSNKGNRKRRQKKNRFKQKMKQMEEK